MSERHQEGLAHLLYGINMGGGFVALTGEVGTGKTTLCRCLLQQLPDKVDIAMILNPKLNAIELLSTICDELGIFTRYQQSLKNYIDKINEYLLDAYSKGRTTVLLIDEAQNLSMEVLEQIRLLTNLETSKAKLLQIVLVGQPELNHMLNKKALRQLNQRITARYHLLPLSLDETRAYIQHRLTVCNGNPSLFRDSAIRKVYKLSSGIPRVINVLCDRAMLGAYATNTRKITPKIISRAGQETLGLRPYNWVVAVTMIALLLGSVIAGLYIVSRSSPLLSHTPFLAQRKLQSAASMAQEQKPNPVVKPEVQKPKSDAKNFDIWLENPQLSLNAALNQAVNFWNQQIPPDSNLTCDSLPPTFRCFSDKANWKELLELDRPAILELSPNSEEKRYALLVGMNKGQAVLRFNDDLSFPLADVLKFWSGNFIILWQPPLPDLVEIAPASRSDNVLWLRQQVSAIAGDEANNDFSPVFDATLKAQVITFQRRHQLTTDGIVGVRTLIHLENETNSDHSPHLMITN